LDYLEFFELRTKAFINVCNPDYYYESYDHIEALNRLIYLIEEGNMGFGVLTGEIGCGKTMTRQVLKKKIDTQHFRVLDMDNSNLQFPYILFELVRQLSQGNMDPALNPAEPYYLIKAFEYYIQHQFTSLNLSTVLILDEAQELSPQTLIDLKGLTNLNSQFHSALTIILVGQPELRDLISSLPAIDQRVSLRFHLNPLSTTDVNGYVERRLRVAGHPTGKIFENDALHAIAKDTKGIPREVNRACQLSLHFAAAQQQPIIILDTVQAVLKDLERQRGGRSV
jgi:general secretion pathway protein A